MTSYPYPYVDKSKSGRTKRAIFYCLEEAEKKREQERPLYIFFVGDLQACERLVNIVPRSKSYKSYLKSIQSRQYNETHTLHLCELRFTHSRIILADPHRMSRELYYEEPALIEKNSAGGIYLFDKDCFGDYSVFIRSLSMPMNELLFSQTSGALVVCDHAVALNYSSIFENAISTFHAFDHDNVEPIIFQDLANARQWLSTNLQVLENQFRYDKSLIFDVIVKHAKANKNPSVVSLLTSYASSYLIKSLEESEEKENKKHESNEKEEP